ncbi:MAG: YihA family ribosome biogenesis GTP-binding protein [Thiothrix sp.]|nr:YihA family ribosome biogenesis GTP-binding protein [Thiothrix sp.]HPE59107.1 ribosome biogenesis GTP-binding protein YihA/YsxC [Thiolinea sp.]
MNPYFQQAVFRQSAAHAGTLPPEGGAEVAFAGRSNSGKSSTINRLCYQRGLARTSKTPGRTRLINFFSLPDGAQLVDLPGYGYAKVPDPVRREWQAFIEAYLGQRACLRGLVIIMDIRHPLTGHDRLLLDWASQRRLPVHVLLNKSDKLKRGPAANTLLQVRRELNALPGEISVQTFSADSGDGLETLWGQLEYWLGREAETPDNPPVQ